MIGVASLACRSCVTIDALRRLCTDAACSGCMETGSGPAATQSACRNSYVICMAGEAGEWWPAAKMRHNTGPHSAVTRSMSPRRQQSSYRFVWLALLMSAAGQQIITQHTANWAQPWVAAWRRDGYFKQRHHWTLSLPTLTICSHVWQLGLYVRAASCSKPHALITTLPVVWVGFNKKD